MKVNLDNRRTFFLLCRLDTWALRLFLFEHSLCNNLWFYRHCFFRNILFHQIIDDCIFIEKVIFPETMQFIELYSIYANFSRAGIFQAERFILLECKKLYTDFFQVIQVCFIEFLQEYLRIWLYRADSTAYPSFFCSAHIVITQEVVAVIHQVTFVRRG